jgi:inorganic pyrophosphatase
MADLSAFPNRWDRKRYRYAIFETPKNRRNKFDYDPESNLFKRKRASKTITDGIKTFKKKSK